MGVVSSNSCCILFSVSEDNFWCDFNIEFGGCGGGDFPHDWSTGCFWDALLSCILFSATRLKVFFAIYFGRYR
jgi:hypothetical protein